MLVDGKVNAKDRVIVKGVQKVRDGQAIRLVRPTRVPAEDVELRPSRQSEAGNDGG